jgi:hypothetical protein
MSQQPVLDPNTMPLDELARLANEELQNDGQPRDEQGRFIATEDHGQDNDQGQDTPDEIVYRRVIDLGDGSGTQVFEAATPEDLIEKLAEAQVHATRKIRELSKAKETPAPAAVELNPDEEFVLSQQFLQSPTKAFAELFKRTTGLTVDEFNKERVKVSKLAQEQSEFQTGREFVQTHPDYFNSDKNNTKLEKWLKTEGLPVTVENLGKAYNDLSESGLLEPRPQKEDVEPGQRVVQPRIAAPTQRIVGQRRAASGLSNRGGSVETPRSLEPTMDDLYNMPLDKLEAMARRSGGN